MAMFQMKSAFSGILSALSMTTRNTASPFWSSMLFDASYSFLLSFGIQYLHSNRVFSSKSQSDDCNVFYTPSRNSSSLLILTIK